VPVRLCGPTNHSSDTPGLAGRLRLRFCDERPHRRAADQRDEVPAFHSPMPPVLPAERVAQLVRPETAALRHFKPAYVSCGSKADITSGPRHIRSNPKSRHRDMGMDNITPSFPGVSAKARSRGRQNIIANRKTLAAFSPKTSAAVRFFRQSAPCCSMAVVVSRGKQRIAASQQRRSQ
jgi:hypothetical protein